MSYSGAVVSDRVRRYEEPSQIVMAREEMLLVGTTGLEPAALLSKGEVVEEAGVNLDNLARHHSIKRA